MNQSNPLQMAQQGDPQALAALINKTLKAQGLNARVAKQGQCLRVLVQGEQLPNQAKMVGFITSGVEKLEVAGVNELEVLGQQTGTNRPAWSQKVPLRGQQPPAPSAPAKETRPVKVVTAADDEAREQRRAARANELTVLTELIHQAFGGEGVEVKLSKKMGVLLEVKLTSKVKLDSKVSLAKVAGVLNQHKPHSVTSVRVSGSSEVAPRSWTKYLDLKKGVFVDNTLSLYIPVVAILLVVGGALYWVADYVIWNDSPATPIAVETPTVDPVKQAEVQRGSQVFASAKADFMVTALGTDRPVVSVILPRSAWDRMPESDQLALGAYAQTLIGVVKSNPGAYVDIPATAPAYDPFVDRAANLCDTCWSIIVSGRDYQPYLIDEEVMAGR